MRGGEWAPAQKRKRGGESPASWLGRGRVGGERKRAKRGKTDKGRGKRNRPLGQNLGGGEGFLFFFISKPIFKHFVTQV